MRITLKEPELELEVFKVDTPTGVGWCVILPDERKVLLKFHQGKWQTADNISNQSCLAGRSWIIVKPGKIQGFFRFFGFFGFVMFSRSHF